MFSSFYSDRFMSILNLDDEMHVKAVMPPHALDSQLYIHACNK